MSLPRGVPVSSAVRAVRAPFAVSRVAVLLAGYAGVLLLGFEPSTVRFRISSNELINLAARWDAQWYLAIATDGYRWNGNADIQQPVVFFPLLPMAMHVGRFITGLHLLNGGLLAAICAFFFALVYFYRIAAPLIGDPRARTAVWALAAYPFAVYFAAPYTEALYLLGCLAAFFHLARGEWGISAGWGLLVGLSRPNGFLLAIPLAAIAAARTAERRKAKPGEIAAAAAPVGGMLAYSAYLYAIVGDPIAWVKGQAAWGRSIGIAWPHAWTLASDPAQHAAAVSVWPHSFTSSLAVLHALAALLVLLSIRPTLRRFGLPFALFTAVNILPPLLTGGLQSIGRMTSVIFPAFMWIAAAVPERHAARLIALFLVGQIFVAVVFFTWRAIY
jgi:hypothetical protein